MTAASTEHASNRDPGLLRLAEDLFAALARIGADGVGITRRAFDVGEDEAMAHVAAVAEAEGLVTGRDAAGSLVIELPGAVPGPAIWAGSHLDSVPHGGNFDGAAGVIAALLALVRMRREGLVPPRPVRAVALRCEESAWFGRPCLGSSALFGRLSADDLAVERRGGGPSLDACFASAGADIDRIRAGRPLVDPKEVAAWLELHIEQGPVMVDRKFRTAVVTGIRGSLRHARVACRGEAGHSGAVPRWLRHDAVFATADLITRLDEHWVALQEQGVDLVVTVGVIGTDPAEHAMSRIPGACDFSFEVRSQSEETLWSFHELFESECMAVGGARGVTFTHGRPVVAEPARMDPRWIERLVRISEALGLPPETIPSGAGHDAAVFANAGVPSAMIFVRNDRGSHNPDEAMELADFMDGAALLFHAMMEPP